MLTMGEEKLGLLTRGCPGKGHSGEIRLPAHEPPPQFGILHFRLSMPFVEFQ